MKTVLLSPAAREFLRRNRAVAPRILAKLDDLAAGAAMPGSVKRLTTGQMRLRVGDFRVVYVETGEAIDVLEIGPRGTIYR